MSWSAPAPATRGETPTWGCGPTRTDVARWLFHDFTTELLRAVLPEIEHLPVERHPLPNLRAVNFVVHGLLGWGVASNLLLDTQAKGLGELLRSRAVEVPVSLVASGPPAARWAAWRRGGG